MLIGISGKKQSGKNTVANFIKKNTKSEWDEKSFATVLKDMTCVLLGCTREELEDQTFKETPLGEPWWCYKIGGALRPRFSFQNKKDNNMAEERFLFKPTPRYIMQTLGTEYGRKVINPDVWVNSCLQTYNSRENWIITDVRFENEAKAIQKKGGILIRVNRAGLENEDTHPSETALDSFDGWDHVINNDKSVTELNLSVLFMLNKLKIQLK